MSSLHESYEKEIRKQKPGAPDLLPGYLDRICGEKIPGHEEIRSSRWMQAGDRGMRNALWLRRKRIAS